MGSIEGWTSHSTRPMKFPRGIPLALALDSAIKYHVLAGRLPFCPLVWGWRIRPTRPLAWKEEEWFRENGFVALGDSWYGRDTLSRESAQSSSPGVADQRLEVTS